jgi:Ni,Fe-hydrogenase III component G
MNLSNLVNQVVAPKNVKAVKSVKATAKKPAKEKLAKAIVKTAKAPKEKLPAFVVFFRADRNKWIATNALGQQEAARKTEAAAYAFLMKKYNKKGTALVV